MLNSRNVALVLSGAICFITTLLLALLSDLSSLGLLVTAMVSFCSSFILIFLTLELLVYRELRKIYQIFDKYAESDDRDNKDISVKKMGKKLFAYAATKQREIEHLKKLENFRREFLADISHELKTPVFAAQGFIHTLMDGAVNDLNVRDKFLKKSAKSLDDLNTLVQDLITISHVESGEIILQHESFDVAHLLKEVTEQFEPKASKRDVTLHLEIGNDGPFPVKADYFRMRQVVNNLVDNAIKYGGAGCHIYASCSRKRDAVEIIVRDTGPGIPEQHQDRVFQRFYRVDKSRSRERGGTGLGLSIVKHIVEAHDSQISLISKDGKGTKFIFKLKLDKKGETAKA